MYDPRLSLPAAPTDAIAAAPWVPFTATVVFLGISAIAFCYGVRQWRTGGQPIILMMLLGGLLTSIVEPYLNVIGACWHPVVGQHIAFDLMGRPIPVWVVSIYLFFFGAVGSAGYMLLEKGQTMRNIWLCFLGVIVVDMIAEELLLSTGLYIYYGPQPVILVSKLPLWWAASNATGMFIGIALIRLMAPHLRGAKWLLVAPVMMMSELFGYAAIALPSWVVINTPVSWWVNQLGGITSLVMAGFMVHGIALMFGKDSPIRFPVQPSRRNPAASAGEAAKYLPQS
jgi:hypothetical protein